MAGAVEILLLARGLIFASVPVVTSVVASIPIVSVPVVTSVVASIPIVSIVVASILVVVA